MTMDEDCSAQIIKSIMDGIDKAMNGSFYMLKLAFRDMKTKKLKYVQVQILSDDIFHIDKPDSVIENGQILN